MNRFLSYSNSKFFCLVSSITILSLLSPSPAFSWGRSKEKDSSAPSGKAGGSGKDASFKDSSAKDSSASVLHVAPLLLPGQPARLSVTDERLSGKPGVVVKVGGTDYTTDESGQVRFDVPEDDTLEITIAGVPGSLKVFIRQDDELVLVAYKNLVRLNKAVSEFRSRSAAPRIVWSQTVVVPGQEFLVLGSGYGPNEPACFIDGKKACVLASTKDSLICALPFGHKLGPVKEFYVEAGDRVSNVVELDVCETFVDVPKEVDPDGAPVDGVVGVRGTNVPAAVLVTNNNLDSVSAWLPDKTPMGQEGLLVTPGGEANQMTIGFLLMRPYAEASFRSELLGDTGFFSTQGARKGLGLDLCRGQIVRINRRLLTVKTKLEESRKALDANPADESAAAELKALSLRRTVLTGMLAARRAMFLSLGGGEEEYSETIDNSEGGATLALNAAVGGVTLASGAQFAVSLRNDPAPRPRRSRPHRMIEPKIKLLLPMSDEELSIQKELSSKAEAVYEAAKKNGTVKPDAERELPANASSGKPEGAASASKKAAIKKPTAKLEPGKKSATSSKSGKRKQQVSSSKTSGTRSMHKSRRRRR